MDKKTRMLVLQRADGICEYCRLWQEHEPFIRFQVEHIIPTKHGGSDALFNLALTCYFCNTHKSSNLTGIDPKTRRLARVFKPRKQKWERHFRWSGVLIVGRTPVGRTTVEVFGMNLPARIALRETLVELGQWPYQV
jgi:hypothetical protein